MRLTTLILATSFLDCGNVKPETLESFKNRIDERKELIVPKNDRPKFSQLVIRSTEPNTKTINDL